MLNHDDFSNHAKKRFQQRGIAKEVIDTVLRYGRVVNHGGSKKYYMDKKARWRARNEMGAEEYRRIVDRLNIYVVVADATVVTVAKRRKRMRFSKPHKPMKHSESRMR